MTGIGFSSFVPLRFRAFGAHASGTRDRMHDMIQTKALPFIFFFSNCLSSELRVEFCQYSRAFFALSAIHFGIFARRALVRSRTPMILCLSNARS